MKKNSILLKTNFDLKNSIFFMVSIINKIPKVYLFLRRRYSQ